jgi:hypothetical protein
MGAELTIGGVSDYEYIKDQVLRKVRRHPPAATESGDETNDEDRIAVDSRTGRTTDELTNLRRIRELLEQEVAR